MNQFVAGTYRTAQAQKESAYRYFLPSSINRSFDIHNKKVIVQLEEATRLLGELNAYGTLVPDINFFIWMHVLTEAVSSSKIEGTKTNMDEALLPEEEIMPEKRDDWHEVRSYTQAMNEAIANLAQLPVSARLIKETHATLMQGARGDHKQPGCIRTSQNWIGGASINSAHFVPPHHEHVAGLIQDWENFWHNSEIDFPVLLKIAIGHYQFETIHPFSDGNGRIGRLLITLQLMERGFLNHPVLYISHFFEKHRQAYYQALDQVRSDNALEAWILFFLDGVIHTVKQSQQTFTNIIALRQTLQQKIQILGKKVPRALVLLDHLFSHPIVNVKDVQKHLDVQYAAANNLVQDFEQLNILTEKTGFSRNRYFAFDDYIVLFK